MTTERALAQMAHALDASPARVPFAVSFALVGGLAVSRLRNANSSLGKKDARALAATGPMGADMRDIAERNS